MVSTSPTKKLPYQVNKLLSFYALKKEKLTSELIRIIPLVVTGDLVLSPCSLLLSVHVLAVVFEMKSCQETKELWARNNLSVFLLAKLSPR